MRIGVRAFAGVYTLVLSLFLFAGFAQAQTSTMAPGDAAVTGFSGTPADTSDQPFDLDGPSLRVLSLPSGGDFGLTDAARRYTATASDIGQVFGVALDNAAQPNIYVAATSAYGLAIVTPDGRTRRGAANADFAPGQFGPGEEGGGPNSIWRIDGRTGQVSLFADVQFNDINGSPAGLGGLAFDPATNQLFATDRGTGMIHRFSMDGNDQGTYDHGEDGRAAAGQAPVSFDPSTLADITKHDFDSQNARTWGYAPEGRRVFALAVHNGRLFYSVADGPSVWSVGIAKDGSFAGDPRFEVQVPALRSGIEISAIAFDSRGWMYLAERGAPTGDPDFVGVADDGKSRVKRFQPSPDNDPSNLWVEPGDEYAIGMAPQYRNADGGVALQCSKNVWSTGERLLDDAEASPDQYPHVDGLQGEDYNQVLPRNAPPEQSWFVNYYDYQADPESRGHMGAVAIWNICGGGGAVLPPPAIRIGFTCPAGTFWIGGECMFAPACPEGTSFRRGYCVYANCPWGFIRASDRCVKPPRTCRFGEVYFRDRCVPIGCPQNLRFDRRGYCGCPPGESYRDGTCSRRPPCDPWLFRATNGTCRRCPDGSIPRNGTCSRRPPCDPVLFRLTNGTCRRCPDGSLARGGQCTKLPCDPLLYRATHGTCRRCPDNGILRDNQCVKRPPCENGIAAVRDCVRKPPCKRGDRLCGDVTKKPGCRDGERGCTPGTHDTGCKRGARGCGVILKKGDGTSGGTVHAVGTHHVRKPHGSRTSGGSNKKPASSNTRETGVTKGGEGGGSGAAGGHGERTRGAHGRNGASNEGGAGGNGGDGTRGAHGRNGLSNEGAAGNDAGTGGGDFGRHARGAHGRNGANSEGGMTSGGGGGASNNNAACPNGEVRRGRRCVPEGGGNGGNNGNGGGRGGRRGHGN
jgi:hypothetical protein